MTEMRDEINDALARFRAKLRKDWMKRRVKHVRISGSDEEI